MKEIGRKLEKEEDCERDREETCHLRNRGVV